MVTFILLISWMAFATDKPACDSKGITRDCAFFEEKKDQPIISLGDGKYFLNPRFERKMNYRVVNMTPANSAQNKSSLSNSTSKDPTREEQEKAGDQHLKNQANIQDLLDGTKLTTPVRVFLSQWAVALELKPDVKKRIPWPLDQKDASAQTKTGAEILAEVKKIIGPERYQAFINEVQKQKSPIESQLQIFQQQEALRYEVEQQEKARTETLNAMQVARNKEIDQLFEEARRGVISTMTHGKPEKEWTPEEKILVAKIQSLVFKGPGDEKLQKSPLCKGNKKNAFYTPDGTVNLCSGFQNEHNAYIMAIISHEIAHSVDPCQSQMPEWKVDLKKVKEMLSQPNLEEDLREALKSLEEDGFETVHLDFDLVLEEPKTKEKLQAAGVIRKVRDGISPDKYPLKREDQCLIEKNKFKDVTKEEIEETKKYLASRLEETMTPQEALKISERYGKVLSQYPQCLRTSTHEPQMGETIGDMAGAVNAEKYLLENPPKDETERVGAIGFAHEACSKTKISFSPMAISGRLFDILADEHPMKSSRVSKVGLNLPGMAEIYGCKREHQSCFDHLSTYRPGSSAVQSPSQEKPGVTK